MKELNGKWSYKRISKGKFLKPNKLRRSSCRKASELESWLKEELNCPEHHSSGHTMGINYRSF
ncbi:hypothetical protein E6R44_07125 [Enterobacter hormaechei]|nr:hypothetical protein E6R44_07125 [Enterobacter hormaechei]